MRAITSFLGAAFACAAATSMADAPNIFVWPEVLQFCSPAAPSPGGPETNNARLPPFRTKITLPVTVVNRGNALLNIEAVPIMLQPGVRDSALRLEPRAAGGNFVLGTVAQSPRGFLIAADPPPSPTLPGPTCRDHAMHREAQDSSADTARRFVHAACHPASFWRTDGKSTASDSQQRSGRTGQVGLGIRRSARSAPEAAARAAPTSAGPRVGSRETGFRRALSEALVLRAPSCAGAVSREPARGQSRSSGTPAVGGAARCGRFGR